MDRQKEKPEIVAVFDFDGTITSKSTTLPFLKFISGRYLGFKLIRKIPIVIAYHLQLVTIDQLNAAIASTFFKDLPRDFLYENGQDFANQILPDLIKDEAKLRVEWHKKQGHTCILATSAYNLYVDYWAEQNGFDGFVSTKIEFNQQGRATGRLDGKSCNGKEKLRRVQELIGAPDVVYAYGDSGGDTELLNYATYSYYKRLT
ncbi:MULTISPECIES: HAD-IB family hydrolase [unclassified Legionella]|uniref:HAD-IB family hydrolase n=1 Tax=unclassified Legionella TaxID=2622702 RepID=UPI0010564EEA|nr:MULTISPECIES: HAD-IB family hydrolase [unclassified Legionella]MDI9818484.1 HAD-IB family hydrolase [Legionella sp. PL877]